MSEWRRRRSTCPLSAATWPTGGLTVRPEAGSTSVRVTCGGTSTEYARSENGLVTRLFRSSCLGGLRVEGTSPGGWYWISGERKVAVAPLMCADLPGRPAAVDPGGVFSRATEHGMYFRHDTHRLIGAVPHVASDRGGS